MATLQRPYRGSRVSSFYPVKSLPPLSSLDSAFQLQEYISLLIRRDVHDVDAIVAVPGKHPQNESLDSTEPEAQKPEDADRKTDVSVDKECWIYEQLRRLAQDLSHPLITMLQQECTRSSCPQMKAGEWLYLCVAHGNDGAMEQCCAIDYILHTVDSATALLNSPRAFPSRLSIPQTSHRHFSSLARRLGRIFAHAYFHHREAFEQAEAESALYARFLKLTSQFELVPPEFLLIPESDVHDDDKNHSEEVKPSRILSAAVHPIPNLQRDTPAMDMVSDAGLNHSRAVDTANQLGTDSPRKLGRNRTDTMVFSEAYNMVEELPKGEDGDRSASGGSLLGNSPITESQPLVSGQPWSDSRSPSEDLDDEDICDARSDLTLSGPPSPSVEELSLISLEDTPSVVTPHEVAPTLPSEPPPHGPPSDDVPAIKSSSEEPIQVVDASEGNVLADKPSMSEVVEPPLEEAHTAASEALTESTQVLPGLEERAVETVSENVDSVPLSGEEESKGTAPHAESELQPSPPPKPMLELIEPPPCEPTPPESESDITDEVGGLDGNEVRQGGEEEAVVRE